MSFRLFPSLWILLLSILGNFQLSAQQFRALLFTKTNGFHHVSINEGVDAIRELGHRHLFSVDWQEDPGVFSDDRLKNVDVIIFLNTTGDILNDDQQAAVERFIRSGKGFVGIHSAADTEYDWPWYTQLVGRMFHIHPQIQTAVTHVEDKLFPGTEQIPANWLWTDEWYQYDEEKTEGLQYILSLDETTYDPNVQWGDNKGGPMGFHPMARYHEFDGGRAFYTGLGHMPECYSDPVFRNFLYGGIYWAATGKGMHKKM